MKKTILVVIFLGITLRSVLAQNSNDSNLRILEGGLKIGDSIPEALWYLPLQVVNHPEGKDTITLNEYRGKLIILDFWGTHCAPCILSIDKIDSLKNLLPGDQIAFLPIIYGTNDEAEKFVKKRGWSLPSLVNDPLISIPSSGQYASKAAFNRYLAGYGTVWIYRGKLLAVPFTTSYLDENIIKAILTNKKVDFIMDQNPQLVDPIKPLFTKGNGDAHVMFRNGSKAQLARYSPEIFSEQERVQFITKSDNSILYGLNLSLENLYYEAYKMEIFSPYHAKDGIRWEISSHLKSRLFFKNRYEHKKMTLTEQIKRIQWLENNLYGYQLRFPERLRESEARYFMQQDLNKFFSLYFGIEGKIEYQNKQKYAVLRLMGTKEETEKLLTQEPAGLRDTLGKGIEYRERVTYDQHFKGDLSRLIQKSTPELQQASLIDSTGISLEGYIVNSLLPKKDSVNLTRIQKYLAFYKLCVSIEDKPVPILVIREKAYKPKPGEAQTSASN